MLHACLLQQKLKSKKGISLPILIMLLAILAMLVVIAATFIVNRVHDNNLSQNRMNALQARHDALISYAENESDQDQWYLYNAAEDTITDVTNTKPENYYEISGDNSEDPANWTVDTAATSIIDEEDSFKLGDETPNYWIAVVNNAKVIALYTMP